MTTKMTDKTESPTPIRGIGKLNRWFLIVFVIFGVLFGDHVIGHVYFKHLCEQESGTKIFQVVPKADGFWWWAIGDARFVTQYGYDFVEGGVQRDKVTRYVVNGSQVDSINNVKSISRYIIYEKQIELPGGMFVKTEEIIEDTTTGQRLAVETSFAFRSGWLLRTIFSNAFSTVVERCQREQNQFDKFIVNVLKPINAKD